MQFFLIFSHDSLEFTPLPDPGSKIDFDLFDMKSGSFLFLCHELSSTISFRNVVVPCIFFFMSCLNFFDFISSSLLGCLSVCISSEIAIPMPMATHNWLLFYLCISLSFERPGTFAWSIDSTSRVLFLFLFCWRHPLNEWIWLDVQKTKTNFHYDTFQIGGKRLKVQPTVKWNLRPPEASRFSEHANPSISLRRHADESFIFRQDGRRWGRRKKKRVILISLSCP